MIKMCTFICIQIVKKMLNILFCLMVTHDNFRVIKRFKNQQETQKIKNIF